MDVYELAGKTKGLSLIPSCYQSALPTGMSDTQRAARRRQHPAMVTWMFPPRTPETDDHLPQNRVHCTVVYTQITTRSVPRSLSANPNQVSCVAGCGRETGNPERAENRMRSKALHRRPGPDRSICLLQVSLAYRWVWRTMTMTLGSRHRAPGPLFF